MSDAELTCLQKAKLAALAEEYRSMYVLVLFRLTALDRRIPVAGTTLAAFLGAANTLPMATRELLLVGLPIAAVWLLRLTVNHARSFEDALRRIEAVEQQLNALLGESVVGFQSHHPSRQLAIGGRTGDETVRAVLVAGLLLVAGCAYLFAADHDRIAAKLYAAAAGLIALYMVAFTGRLQRYRYRAESKLITT